MTPVIPKKSDAFASKSPVILALEASGDLLSVALSADGAVCHHEFYVSRHGHAARIVTTVDWLMKTAKLNYAQITHIAAGCGPGSFTGIRVTLAAAKGLSFANKIDVYGFNSDQIINKNYTKIVELFNNGLLKKNLIKPNYSS